MKQILEAILSSDTGAVGELDVPEHYRGITVHADEAGTVAHEPKRPVEVLVRQLLR